MRVVEGSRAYLAIPLLGSLVLVDPASATTSGSSSTSARGTARCFDAVLEAVVIDTGPRYDDEWRRPEWTVVDWLQRRRLESVTVGPRDARSPRPRCGGLGPSCWRWMRSRRGTRSRARGAIPRAHVGWSAPKRPACRSRARSPSASGLRGRYGCPSGHCQLAGCPVAAARRVAGDRHTNDRSIVLSLGRGPGGRILSTGDLERAGEAESSSSRGSWQPHPWLKVAHHGGDTGTDSRMDPSGPSAVRDGHSFPAAGATATDTPTRRSAREVCRRSRSPGAPHRPSADSSGSDGRDGDPRMVACSTAGARG